MIWGPLWSVLGTVLWLIFQPGTCSAASISNVGQLKAAMRTVRPSNPACIRLLNATGTVGCGAGRTVAPIARLENPESSSPSGEHIILLGEEHLPLVLQRLSKEKHLRSRVKGILVGSGSSDAPMHSPADIFPLAAYAPYKDRSYPWNPNGTGISNLDLGIPIFHLDDRLAASAQSSALHNSQQGLRGALHVASLDATMWAEGNASTCIQAAACLPLGGHSVWAALPPFPAQPAQDSRPITLVTAAIDSTAFFHDLAKGAEAPLSGLIALLAAAEILGNSSMAAGYQRRLVFVAFAGEPWGYMGSKRFLWELHNGENSTRPLSLEAIEQVVELGQVGRAADSEGLSAFYVHAQRGASFGDARPLAEAFLRAGDSKAEVSEASLGTPGIPPSSLTSFLRVKPAISGLVLTDFNKHFLGSTYQGQHDTNISAQAVTSAALVAARALHEIASGGRGASELKVRSEAVRATVESLMDCLLKSGLTCGLAGSLISPVSRGEPAHYISTLYQLGQDSQDPSLVLKKDMERFLWNFLALRTSSGPAVGADGMLERCDSGDKRCKAGAACIGFKEAKTGDAALGTCHAATAAYVPSYSVRLQFLGTEGGAFRWGLSNTSEAWERTHEWPQDPMWTESNWPPDGIPELQLYQREDSAVEGRMLIGGLATAAVSFAGTYWAKGIWSKHVQSS
ncbi:g7683 [Coccomyxa viridis]|uniref:Nicastrin n=1 Tax=Coccomyxa viridis TaxID=1274662 RepID=A0ABP1G2Z6_9CHLO